MSEPYRRSASSQVIRANGASRVDADRLAPDRRRHCLHQVEDELPVGKRHLHVELGYLLHPIGTEILVAEAARDLVVAVEARDDEELLVDLWRLRQREEATVVQPARYEEVPCALRSRLGEDRCLDLEEARVVHDPADRGDQLRPERDVALQPRAPEVEPAVPKSQRLVDTFLVELERERRAAGHDLERVDLQLDLTGRKARVDSLGGAANDLALGSEHELVPGRVRGGHGLGRPLRVDDELADTCLVAKVDEHEAAVIPPCVGPTREDEALTDVLGAYLATHHVAPTSHPSTVSAIRPTGTGVESPTVACSPSTRTIRFARRRPACVSCPLIDRSA